MIVLGVLYFFSMKMAEGSPLFNFFNQYSKIAFGQLGLLVFFGLSVLMGILILIKGYLAKFLLKYYLLLLMLISAMLNVRLWTHGKEIDYIAQGGYFSWPLIWILDKVLKNPSGTYILAIKWIIGVFLLGAILYLLYKFNVRLPKLPTLTIEQAEKPKQENKKSDTSDQSRPVITITRPDISTESIIEKVSQATGISREKKSESQVS